MNKYYFDLRDKTREENLYFITVVGFSKMVAALARRSRNVFNL